MKENYVPTADDLAEMFATEAWQWLSKTAANVAKKETEVALDWSKPNEQKIHASGVAEGIGRFTEERIREVCANMTVLQRQGAGESVTKQEVLDEYRG